MKCFLLLFALLVTTTEVFAQGGPPLLTDDPDPPGNNHWEVNVYTDLQASGVYTYELPHADFNYGLGDSIQLKWETGLAGIKDGTEAFRVGWEDSLFGVKWRFLNGGEKGLSLGTYPQFGTRLFSSSDPSLSGPTRYAILPVEMKYPFGKLVLDAELGMLLQEGADNGFEYGLCGGYNITPLLELIAEVHGTSGNPVVFPPGLIAQVGARAALNETIAVITSVGNSLAVPSGGSNTFLCYLGLRITP